MGYKVLELLAREESEPTDCIGGNNALVIQCFNRNGRS